MKIIAKYIHGSGDSLDNDVMYAVDRLPSLAECKKFCSEDKSENRNLIVIKDGEVVDCYKGTPDECNNSLYWTFRLHDQEYPLLVDAPVKRDLNLKAMRAVRGILSHLSKTQYRPVIKAALKSRDWQQRISALESIDLSAIDFDSCQNNMSGADIKKLIAFQCGQTISLAEGPELYTKREVSKKFESLRPYMERRKTDTAALTAALNELIKTIKGLDMSEYDVLAEKKVGGAGCQ